MVGLFLLFFEQSLEVFDHLPDYTIHLDLGLEIEFRLVHIPFLSLQVLDCLMDKS